MTHAHVAAERSIRTAAAGISKSGKFVEYIKDVKMMLEDIKPELMALRDKLNEMGNSL